MNPRCAPQRVGKAHIAEREVWVYDEGLWSKAWRCFNQSDIPPLLVLVRDRAGFRGS